jgi:heme exporter protein D
MKAVNSIIPIIQTSSSADAQLEQYFMAMIGRLGQREWFAAKVCVCTMIVPMVKSFPQRRQELLECASLLC